MGRAERCADGVLTPTHRANGYVLGIARWPEAPEGVGPWRGWVRPVAGGEWERDIGAVGTRRELVRRAAAEVAARGGEPLCQAVAKAAAEIEAAEAERERARAEGREAELAEAERREIRRAACDAAAMAARFRRTEVAVATRSGLRPVPALVHGGLAVHRARQGAGFTVTHAASGARVLTAPTQGMARVAAVRLAAIGDWSAAPEALARDAGLRAAVAALADDVYAERPEDGRR